MTATATAARERAAVLGCMIDRLDMAATVQRCDDAIRSGAPVQQVSVNVAKLVSLRTDPRLRAVVEGCEIVSADGQGVVWASRVLGDALPARVAGIDLMLELLALAEARRYRVFFLGAHQDVLDDAVARIMERHPALQLAGLRHGYFADAETPEVCEEVRTARPDMLFVAMSSPRKEYFLGEVGADLGVPFRMGVGGSLDVIAGRATRAPMALQRLGLEWLVRLLQEPRRLGRRYLVTNARFAVLVARALLARGWRRLRGAGVRAS